MNGYGYVSATYRKAAEEGEVSQDYAEKICKAYDFLESCDDEDLYNLFDSSAFNEIAKCYLRLACKELVEEDVIDEEQGQAVRNRFSLLFDEMQAEEACKVEA